MLGWNIQIENDPFEKFKYDLKLFARTELSFKVYPIDDISDLINNEMLINEFNETSFFDSLIILGNKPFLSNNGFYSNETNIQIGWVYSHGQGDWDHVMLKSGFDISNSIFYIENFIYDITSYKDYLNSDSYPLIKEYWEDASKAAAKELT